MERPNTRQRTLFPSARWLRPWRSRRADVATGGDAPGPVGYLVNRPGGLAGVHGIGYDYVLGSSGRLRPVRERKPDGAGTRRPLRGAGARARGREGLSYTTAPSRQGLFEIGLSWFEDDPDTERFFAVRWDGRSYRLVVPPQTGDGDVPRIRTAPPGWSPSSTPTGAPAPSSRRRTTGDEQGFRIYGVAGRLDTDRPELGLRVGVYGHFAPVNWSQVFDGPNPGRPVDS